ncbi:Transcriptional regulator [Ruminococcaceae bacterium YRB3002]|nr:Transcriptional regulator [Ruminococcaceae bacterium YRB3002]
MELTSYKFTSAIQALLYARYCNDNNIKATSSVIAAAIGVDSTVLRVVLTELNTLDWIDAKPGPGGIKVRPDKFDLPLIRLFDDLNDSEVRRLFNVYEPYNDGNAAINAINGELQGGLFDAGVVFERFEKTTLNELYGKVFG